jgi:hypothetical protein
MKLTQERNYEVDHSDKSIDGVLSFLGIKTKKQCNVIGAALHMRPDGNFEIVNNKCGEDEACSFDVLGEKHETLIEIRVKKGTDPIAGTMALLCGIEFVAQEHMLPYVNIVVECAGKPDAIDLLKKKIDEFTIERKKEALKDEEVPDVLSLRVHDPDKDRG